MNACIAIPRGVGPHHHERFLREPYERKPVMRLKKEIALQLPQEFLDLCMEHKVYPETVLKGFIADLCDIRNYVSNPRDDGYCSNGSDERMYAQQWFHRCWYSMPDFSQFSDEDMESDKDDDEK